MWEYRCSNEPKKTRRESRLSNHKKGTRIPVADRGKDIDKDLNDKKYKGS